MRASTVELRSAARVAVVAVGMQLLHFGEELATGFPERLPPQLGLAPWSQGFFVGFNLFWLAVWTWSACALTNGSRLARAALWFLAIAGIVNSIAHPALALRAGGYFPGLFTSPLVGIAGFALARRLARIMR